MNKFSKDFSKDSVKVPKQSSDNCVIPHQFWIDVKKHLENVDYDDYTCNVISVGPYGTNWNSSILRQAMNQWDAWYNPENGWGSWLHHINSEDDSPLRSEEEVKKLRKLMINAVIHGKNKARIKAMIAGVTDIKDIK